jgi:hypothetical protein
MGTVEICDDSMWLKHIDDERIGSLLERLGSEEIVPLLVDGELGLWARMKQGANPHLTRGLKPAGEKTRAWWAMQQQRRGTRVEIRLAKIADVARWELSA